MKMRINYKSGKKKLWIECEFEQIEIRLNDYSIKFKLGQVLIRVNGY